MGHSSSVEAQKGGLLAIRMQPRDGPPTVSPHSLETSAGVSHGASSGGGLGLRNAGLTLEDHTSHLRGDAFARSYERPFALR
jgi:hypothetical protein